MKERTYARLAVLSFSHMVNDWYMNFIQSMLPLLVAAGLSAGKSGFLVSVFTITSSLMQPVIGTIVDRKNQKWFVYVGTLFMAVLLSLFGLIGSYPLLLAVVGIAGLGTAAFHPQASAMTASISAPARRSTFQAIFIASGNIGWALTPLVAVPAVTRFGFHITPVFVLPGILAFLLLLSISRFPAAPKKASAPFLPALRGAWRELTKLMLVVAMRSLTYFGMVSFLALYFKTRGVSTLISSRLLFLMLFAGAMGGLLGGFLADRFGRKPVLSVSLFLAGVLFLLFLLTGGVISYVLLTAAGAALLASFSVTVVLAQSLISRNAAMASGLMLGFGTGIGGLGVGLFGLLIDHAGIMPAMILLSATPLLGALLSLFIHPLARGQAASDARG